MLELGVGTARVAAAIAKEGIDVVGIDPAEPMLKRAEERLARLPRRARERVSLRRHDLRTLRLRRRFPLVIAPFNVWMHLYTRRDVELGFAAVRRHLEPHGHFGFDVLLPDPLSLGRNPAKGYRGGKVPHPRGDTKYDYTEYFAYDPGTQIQTVQMRFAHPNEPNRSFRTPLTQRQFFPAELEALLHYNGFVVEAQDGDFDGDDLGPASESQVVIARIRSK